MRRASVASAEIKSKMLVMNVRGVLLLRSQLSHRQILDRCNHKPHPELQRDALSKNSIFVFNYYYFIYLFFFLFQHDNERGWLVSLLADRLKFIFLFSSFHG